MPFATEPLTFTAGKRLLEQKAILPLGLDSREISLRLPAQLRLQAFFSAKVTGAHLLEKLKAEVEKVARGESDYTSARARIKEFQQALGTAVPGVGEAGEKDVRNIASTTRLDLVLRQNVAMAHAVAQREVAEHPAVMEVLPCYEYVANTDRHAEFDGLVLPKNDPFWDTHLPPWDYNCKCMVIDTDAEPNGKSAGFKSTPEGAQQGRVSHRGRVYDVSPASSGFVFDSRPSAAFSAPDFSTIEDPELRAEVESQFQKQAKKLGLSAPEKK